VRHRGAQVDSAVSRFVDADDVRAADMRLARA
jgi:hypothetical protein